MVWHGRPQQDVTRTKNAHDSGVRGSDVARPE
jgi:hypothetical protein